MCVCACVRVCVCVYWPKLLGPFQNGVTTFFYVRVLCPVQRSRYYFINCVLYHINAVDSTEFNKSISQGVNGQVRTAKAMSCACMHCAKSKYRKQFAIFYKFKLKTNKFALCRIQMNGVVLGYGTYQ